MEFSQTIKFELIDISTYVPLRIEEELVDNNQQVPVVCMASKTRENEIISKVSFILLDFVVPVVEYNVSVDPILLSFLLLVLLNVVNEVAFDIPNTPKDFL